MYGEWENDRRNGPSIEYYKEGKKCMKVNGKVVFLMIKMLHNMDYDCNIFLSKKIYNILMDTDFQDKLVDIKINDLSDSESDYSPVELIEDSFDLLDDISKDELDSKYIFVDSLKNEIINNLQIKKLAFDKLKKLVKRTVISLRI